MNHPAAFNRVALERERERQDAKWGDQKHTRAQWHAILSEEVGEAAREIVEHGPDELWRRELIHVAAVAVQIVENLDRGKVLIG